MPKKIVMFILIINLCLAQFAFAAPSVELGSDFYLNKTKVVEQQIELLKNRLAQLQNEATDLAQQEADPNNLTLDRVNKQWLDWTKLDIAVAKSNIDSINIELSESQQTVNLLEKDTQEIENQLNIFGISKYNLVGAKRQEAGIRDTLRDLAAHMGGDAIINLTHDNNTVTGTIIAFRQVT